eukprot:2268380-Rhodomonas_salina.3
MEDAVSWRRGGGQGHDSRHPRRGSPRCLSKSTAHNTPNGRRWYFARMFRAHRTALWFQVVSYGILELEYTCSGLQDTAFKSALMQVLPPFHPVCRPDQRQETSLLRLENNVLMSMSCRPMVCSRFVGCGWVSVSR